jgi:hypothetical protein
MSPEPSNRSPREDRTRPDPLRIDDLKCETLLRAVATRLPLLPQVKTGAQNAQHESPLTPTGADGQQHHDPDIWNYWNEEATELILHEESTTKALSTPVATTCWKSKMI